MGTAGSLDGCWTTGPTYVGAGAAAWTMVGFADEGDAVLITGWSVGPGTELVEAGSVAA